MISLEYLAGFVDGEGCLGFTTSGTVMVPRVTITNTNLEMLERIKAEHGGCLNKHKHNPKWKQGYGLNLTSRQAMNFVDKIYPFLIIKRAQADLFYEYDLFRKGRGQKVDRIKVVEFKERMHLLNKKGV